MFFRGVKVNPPIFADLVVEANGQQARFNVEQKGYLEQVRALLPLATRVGLALRGKSVAVWTQGNTARYYSEVVGQLGPDGNKQARIACLDCDNYKVWLHKDGTVETGQTPIARF